MTVPGGHGDRLVASEFLNLFDRRTRHRQPRAERVAVAVPNVALDLCILQAGYEPRARVEPRALPNEDRIGGVEEFVPQRLEGC